ncbi:glucose PTS transporter subunit EIIB, partial [Clostridioides difficile]
NAKTHWLNIIWVGLIYFAVYYFLFTFLIKKFNFKTPGRDDDEEEVKLYTRADVNAKKEGSSANSSNQDDKISAMILKGLGGQDNLSDLDCCATRLRVTVKDSSKVSESLLKSSGAAGVIIKGNGIQVIYGPRVTVIKSNLEDFIASGANIEVAADLDVVETKQEKKEDKV